MLTHCRAIFKNWSVCSSVYAIQLTMVSQSKGLSGWLGKKRTTHKYQKEKLHLKILIKIVTTKLVQESFLNFTKGGYKTKTAS